MRRTTVMRYPTREYQRDPPSRVTATPPSGNSKTLQTTEMQSSKPIPIDTGSHIRGATRTSAACRSNALAPTCSVLTARTGGLPSGCAQC
jgi:hypothetical protein